MLSLLAMLCLTAAAGAQTVHFHDVSITIKPLPDRTRETRHGYVEHRFEVVNHASSPREVEIHVPGGNAPAIAFASATVGPGATSELFVYQTATVCYGGQGMVYIDGARQDQFLPVRSERLVHGMYMSGRSDYSVLCSRMIPSSARSQIEAGAVASGRGGAGPSLCISDLPVAQWSPYWLGYSCYDTVLLTRRDLDQMPPSVWAAITQWTQCGGTLIVLDDRLEHQSPWKPPAGWLGKGKYLYPGFGRCRVVDADYDWSTLSKDFGTSPGDWSERGRDDLDRSFDLVRQSHRTLQVMLMLLIPTAVIIGPLNLWLLARSNRRMWMLVTVPALSLLACGAVLGWSLLSEGIRPWARTIELTVLDERTNQASTLGYLAIYSPLSPSGGLHFDRSTELTAQGRQDLFRMHDMSTRYQTDWTSDQHLTGWVEARVPAYFQVRRSQTCRQRLSVLRKGDGTLAVVNGLGRDVTSLTVRGPGGELYSLDRVPAGQQVDLGPAGAPTHASQTPISLFNGDWRKLVGEVCSQPSAYLPPSSYVAVLSGPTFLELGLDNVDVRKYEAAVIGYLQEWPE